MRKLMNISFMVSIAVFITGCAGTAAVSTGSPANKESLLVQAGFHAKRLTSGTQQRRLRALPAGRVSLVSFRGRTFYVYPNTGSAQVYVGNKDQYREYRRLLSMRRHATPNADVAFTEETRGPNPIAINEYDGWGPVLVPEH